MSTLFRHRITAAHHAPSAQEKAQAPQPSSGKIELRNFLKQSLRASAVLTTVSALGLTLLHGVPVAAQDGKATPIVNPDVLRQTPPVNGNILVNPNFMVSLDPLKNPKSLDDFFNALPDWGSAGNTKAGKPNAKTPDEEKSLGKSMPTHKTENGRLYTIHREHKSITATPADLVSLDPSASVFYPGAILQETGMREGLGSLKLVPDLEGKRAPLKIVLSTGGQTTINDPDYGNVATAVGNLRSGLNGKPMATSTNFDYSVASSAEESAIHLGISAKYLTASAKAVLDTKHEVNQESINGTFIVRAYTISAQPLAGGWHGFLGDKFTVDDAKALGMSGAISRSNQPCYVDSVTYGTIVVFNMTRTLTENEIHAKMEAKASIGVASGSVDAAAESIKKSSNTTVHFTTIGGGYANASDAIKTVGASEFNNTMAALANKAPESTELVPISYTIRALKDRSLAAVQSTTDYYTETAAPNPIGQKFKIHVAFKITNPDDGAFDNTVECWSTVRMNDQQVGGLPRENYASKEKNQTLDLAEIPYDVFYTKRSVKFNIDVIDRDSGSKDDNLGSFNFTLDPTEQADKGTYTMHGGDADLSIVFERVGYL